MRAPLCGHDFRLVNLRKDREIAMGLAGILRERFGGTYFVSELYHAAEGWAVVLCRACGPDTP